ncbi:cystathionine beta-lyase [Streptococcus caprae]|uniref:Cystathionine beta-lyase n=1 Tax=Streptococcus caprae TaxID=1640501 RepID=A0ABV8CY41_9STRE
MTDYVDLALTYGGFTSLDKVYLTRVLAEMTESERLTFITPPPSVINAYFAETYQKQGSEAATAYFFELSQALQLFQTAPSFAEVKPFVRLNLSGQSYGFCFANEQEQALVFAEEPQPVTAELCFNIAQLFPQYEIRSQGDRVSLRPLTVAGDIAEQIDLPGEFLLTTAERLTSGLLKLSSFNQEELLEAAQLFPNAQVEAYAYQQRQFIAYLKNS